jgi:glycosyltransferase involved in cell wall biosynthesis
VDIALINIIKPMAGSGDGITEYTYQLYKALKANENVELIYSLEESKRNNVTGLIRANISMRNKVLRARSKYDVYHITNQEVGFVAKSLKKKFSAPVVTTVHDISRFQAGLQRGVLQTTYNRMVRSYVKDAIFNSGFLLYDSRLTMSEVQKRFGARKNGKVVNIGIKDSVITAKDTERKENDKFSVGYVGSFAHHKNVILLLEAANIIDDERYVFNIYGSGVEERSLLEYKKAKNVKAARFMGFAPENRIVQIYDSFDTFVFPSLYEGFGLPILEAQARGLPVIVYKGGKVSEEVKRYCFEADDAAHMANIIYDLKENGYNEKLKREATAYARSFTWEKCARETLDVYKSLL